MENKMLFCFLALILIIVLIETTVYFKMIYQDNKQYQTSVEKSKDDRCLNLNNNVHQIPITKNVEINEVGLAFDIVPNTVHYILYSIHEIQFGHFISILSVIKNQRPDLIYIHCDCQQLSGDYYQRVLKVANKTNTPIIIRNIEKPTEIFGHKLSERWLNWHSADIQRIRILQEMGGIYLDRDVYVVKPLNEFFKYEITVEWKGRSIATTVIITHKNARFLKLYLQTYHNYTDKLWYYSAGEYPTQTILKKQPHLIHRLQGIFGFGPLICSMLYGKYYENWKKDFHAIHFNIRGNQIPYRNGRFPSIPSILNETNTYQSNVTFGEMARLVFDFEKQINLKTQK